MHPRKPKPIALASLPPSPSCYLTPMPTTKPQPLVLASERPTSPYANPLIPKANTPYPDSTKLQALSIYAETGNASEAARQVGLERTVVNRWVHEDSTPELLDELRSTIRYNYGWELAKLVGKRMASLSEAMDRGDPHVLKNGNTVWVAPSAKDQAITLSILIDKWVLVSGALSQSNALVAGVAKLGSQLEQIGAALTGSQPPTPPPSPMGPLPDPPLGEKWIG